MKKLFLLAAVAVMSVAAVSAQRTKSGPDYQNLRGPFITNSFGENWFISLGAGVNTWYRPSLSCGETYSGFDRVKPVYQLSVGKWVHPYWAFRVQGNYGTIEANTSIYGMYTRDYDPADPSGKYLLQFDYWDVEGAALFHFSNAVGGYKAARFYNAILFAGTGYMQSFGKDAFGNNHTSNHLAFNFGLLNTLRLARSLDFYVELKSNVVRQDFTAATVLFDDPAILYTGAKGWGMLPSATFGFTFRLNNRSFVPAEAAIAYAVSDAVRPFEGRIRDLQDELAAAEARAAAAESAPPRVVVETETVTETVVQQVPMTVFFRIGDATLGTLELLNVRHIAETINSTPDQTFVLTGLADRDTGTSQRNQRLSEERVKVVRNALVEFGVNPDRLVGKALGDTVNPFDLPAMNRVVIVEPEGL